MLRSILIALAIGIFGFVPGMGIPGAIVFCVGEPVLTLFGQQLYCTQGDRAWPAAILATWTWPIFIPLSYFLCFRLLKTDSKRTRWGLFVLALLVSMVLVSLGIELYARTGA